MSSNKTMKWIEAGKILAEDPNEKVQCPECEQNNLEVQDIRNESNPIELERSMHCPVCNARNVLRLKRPI